MSEYKKQLIYIAEKIATSNDPEIKKELETAKECVKELNEKKTNSTLTKVEEDALVFLSALINFSDINI
jgi:hypothetical protein